MGGVPSSDECPDDAVTRSYVLATSIGPQFLGFDSAPKLGILKLFLRIPNQHKLSLQ